HPVFGRPRRANRQQSRTGPSDKRADPARSFFQFIRLWFTPGRGYRLLCRPYRYRPVHYDSRGRITQVARMSNPNIRAGITRQQIGQWGSFIGSAALLIGILGWLWQGALSPIVMASVLLG